MVVDSSALIAILQREPEELVFRRAIKTASNRLLGAPTLVEVSIVVLRRLDKAGQALMQALIDSLRLDVVPLSHRLAMLAIDGFGRFGKGRHPAALNFGDCFAYALAKATGEPLLFKGGDFSQTDIQPAI